MLMIMVIINSNGSIPYYNLCISQPFTAYELVQKIALDFYMGQKLWSKKVQDKFFM